MRQSRIMWAVTAVLIAMSSLPAFASGHGGQSRASHGGTPAARAPVARAVPSHHASTSHQIAPSRYASPSHHTAPAHHTAPSHYSARRANTRVFIGAAVAAPLIVAAPRYYYTSPPRYVAPVTYSDYWYYCPQYQAYYPYVQVCPGPWQTVVPYPY